MKNLLHRGIRCCICIILFFFVTYTKGYSQHLIFGGDNKASIEIGFDFGPNFFLGDLGGHKGIGTKFVKDLNLELTKLMKGAFITFNPNEWIGLRFGAQYTYLEGKDELIKNQGGQELWRKQRNLDFRTKMWEAYTALEFTPIMYFKRNDLYFPRLRPYFFAGIGVFHFNPQGSLINENGEQVWYYLRPLRTEGEGMAEYPNRKEYHLFQVNIPMGAGIKYLVSPRSTVSFEVLYRKTYTDYIDDISNNFIDPKYFDKYLTPENAAIAKRIHSKIEQNYLPGVIDRPGDKRGTASNMDSYFSLAIKIGFRLGSDDEEFYNNPRACPQRF